MLSFQHGDGGGGQWILIFFSMGCPTAHNWKLQENQLLNIRWFFIEFILHKNYTRRFLKSIKYIQKNIIVLQFEVDKARIWNKRSMS